MHFSEMNEDGFFLGGFRLDEQSEAGVGGFHAFLLCMNPANLETYLLKLSSLDGEQEPLVLRTRC